MLTFKLTPKSDLLTFANYILPANLIRLIAAIHNKQGDRASPILYASTPLGCDFPDVDEIVNFDPEDEGEATEYKESLNDRYEFYGQIRIPDWFREESTTECPKYLSFGRIDLMFPTPTPDQEITYGVTLSQLREAYPDWDSMCEYRKQKKITDLVWLHRLSDPGHTLHIIEGFKKAQFLQDREYWAVAIAGCENGLQASEFKQLDESDTIDMAWQIKRNLQRRKLVPTLQKIVTLQPMNVEPVDEPQIILVPDLDFAWKRGVQAGWYKLAVTLGHRFTPDNPRCQVSFAEPILESTGLNRIFTHNKTTGIDDLTNFKGLTDMVAANEYLSNTLANLESIAAENYGTKKDKSAEQIYKEITKDATDLSKEQLRILRQPSIKVKGFEAWLLENQPILDISRVAWFADRREWRFYSESEFVWTEQPSIMLPSLIAKYFDWYHVEILGEPMAGYSMTDVAAVVEALKIMKNTMGQKNTPLLTFNNGDKLTFQEENLETSKASPDDFSIAKTTYQFRRESGVKEEDFPAINSIISQLANNDKEKDYLHAFALASVANLSYLQRHLMLVGFGGTGKSSFAELIRMLMGNDAVCDTDLQQWEGNRFATSSAIGKRVVIFSDEESSFKRSNANLKKLTGNSPIYTEVKNESPAHSLIKAMTLLIANEPPIGDSYSAISRRFKTINCQKIVAKPDPYLLDKVKEELPLWLNWLIDKGVQWAVDTLMEKGDESAMLRSEVDPVFGFVDARFCETQTEVKSDFGDATNMNLLTIYPNYCNYCQSVGQSRMNLPRFKRKLQELAACQGTKISGARFDRGGMIGKFRLAMSNL